ncbi:MAG: PQQ-binding-like beta-propeller repeat protein, partial [Gammaproteobacteria bacterium]
RSELVTAVDTNAEHAQACAELYASMGNVLNLGPYTPWVLRENPEDRDTTLLFPGLVGGPNWGGAAYDPASQRVFVMAADVGTFGWLEPAPQGSDLPFLLQTPRPSSFDVAMGDSRWPCHRPPWGRLTAVDTTTGNIVWQQPLGITAGLPAAKQVTGRAGRAGALVTASGLLFIAATDDDRLRALRVTDGAELWQVQLPARGNANPLSYRGSDGRQYIAIAATERLLSFALPQ